MALAKTKCPSCGEIVQVDSTKPFSFCMNCGAKVERESTNDSGGIGAKKAIENFHKLASNAYSASNFAEAETYCNKILELDPENSQAWMIKGIAAGWQSSIQNKRFSESITAFINAITYSPKNDRSKLILEARDYLMQFAKALFSLRGERYEKWPDSDEFQGFSDDLAVVSRLFSQFISLVQNHVSASDLPAIASVPKEIKTVHSLQVIQSLENAWSKTILPEYRGNDGHPDYQQWSDFKERFTQNLGLLAPLKIFNDKKTHNDDSILIRVWEHHVPIL